MKFLVDECTGPSVAAWLRDDGHEVFSVYEDARGVGVQTGRVFKRDGVEFLRYFIDSLCY